MCGGGVDGSGGSGGVYGSAGSGFVEEQWRWTVQEWFVYGEKWHRVGWFFCGGGGIGGGNGTGGGVCCEASLVMLDWEGGFFVTF